MCCVLWGLGDCQHSVHWLQNAPQCYCSASTYFAASPFVERISALQWMQKGVEHAPPPLMFFAVAAQVLTGVTYFCCC
jgi:hypothetical protein